MSAVITEIEQVTADWLTDVLCRERVVSESSETLVRSLEAERLPAHNSQVWRLSLLLEAQAHSIPQSLIFKQKSGGAGADEVRFARAMSLHYEALPMLVRCYDAQYSEHSRASHLLLEDLTPTHITPVPPKQAPQRDTVPSSVHLAQMVDCVADFHAYWWEHPVPMRIWDAPSCSTEGVVRAVTH